MRTTGSRGVARRAREVGSATLEYVAVIALAGVLVGAAVLPLRAAPPPVRAKLCAVLAALGVAGSCAGGAAATPPGGTADPSLDPRPARCKLGEHGEKVSSEIKIAFVRLGENAGFVETTYSDDTVTYTATDGASVGVTAASAAGSTSARSSAGPRSTSAPTSRSATARRGSSRTPARPPG